jgi:hypothetical protein
VADGKKEECREVLSAIMNALREDPEQESTPFSIESLKESGAAPPRGFETGTRLKPSAKENTK